MAAKRRSRRPRSKTISGTGVTGQKGVNLIEGIVLDMGSRWTPSGPNEVGTDVYIELFDPASRKALGLNLAAQSKAATGVGADPNAQNRIRELVLKAYLQSQQGCDWSAEDCLA